MHRLQVLDDIAFDGYIRAALAHDAAAPVVGALLGEELSEDGQNGGLALEQLRLAAGAVDAAALVLAALLASLLVRRHIRRAVVVGGVLDAGVPADLARLHARLAARRRIPLPLAIRLALTHRALLRLWPVLVPVLFGDGPLDGRGGIRFVGHTHPVAMVLRAALRTGVVARRLALLGMRQGVRVPEVTLRHHKVRFEGGAHAGPAIVRGSGSYSGEEISK